MTVLTARPRPRARTAGCDRVEGRERPGSERALDTPTPERALSLFDVPSGEPTLDALMSGVWEGLAAQQRAACPVCGGTMVAAYGAHARPVEGRCTDCGTTLS